MLPDRHHEDDCGFDDPGHHPRGDNDRVCHHNYKEDDDEDDS